MSRPVEIDGRLYNWQRLSYQMPCPEGMTAEDAMARLEQHPRDFPAKFRCSIHARDAWSDLPIDILCVEVAFVVAGPIDVDYAQAWIESRIKSFAPSFRSDEE